ncbi:MAG TPA: FAD-binding oxidoreductase [Chloroflexia bacterium]|nr:FAD-binding oxidoreductase [Chloroflexia bacterium]
MRSVARRWNGWGLRTVSYPLSPEACLFLAERLGAGRPPLDASWETVVGGVPPSQLHAHPLVTIEPAHRAMHARGQSLPDWIALRGGNVGEFPDGVAYPATGSDVRDLLAYARASGVRVTPYGGGTSVAGHINPLVGDAPTLTIDMSRIQGLRHLSEKSRLAAFGAGVAGPVLEAQLRARGYILGHFPQSFELSTLGGWVATRSSGQQSLGYGRIEHLFAGGRMESPAGTIDMPPFPASAAGPDLRAIVLGSEGRLGILTEAIVRITSMPEREEFHTAFFADWERGMEATRHIIQAGLPMSLLRLSSPEETATMLALAGHTSIVNALKRFLAIRGIREEMCMLLLGFSGRAPLVEASKKEALDLAREHGGVHVGTLLGKQWHKSRFRTPYLRNTLWDMGYAVDTVETATTWDRTPALRLAVEKALRTALANTGERVHVTTHLSHLYPTGSSVYTTFLFRIATDPQETMRRWQALKAAASEAIVAHGGTISHQHGVGADHLPYLEAEKGPLGMAALREVVATFDPSGVMNPGKLFI